MSAKHWLLGAVLLVGAQLAGPARADADAPIAWQSWNRALFDRAAHERRYIVLHMAAVWCHWCHVMEQTTYRDAAVQARLQQHFIVVRIDQDSDPELSYRYERWGWPATIMFDSAGNEIFRRQGYLPPDLFLRLLDAVIADPSALARTEIEASAGSPSTLPSPLRQQIDQAFRGAFDAEHGGFGRLHRLLHGDTIEYTQQQARALHRNEQPALYAEMARHTLDGARRLIDPVWGGMYQYSDSFDWSSPHFEKLLNVQRDAIRCYVLAFLSGGDQRDIAAARDIVRWLLEHMRSAEAAFFASQDADAGPELPGGTFYALDDRQRRARPAPRIDTSLYARENGWVISALAQLYDATGDAALLIAARRAMGWVLVNRRTPSGSFGHAGAGVRDGSLSDTLALGEAALALYRSTAERAWLSLANEIAIVIIRDFRHADAGFVVRQPDREAIGALARPVRQLDENVAVVRFLNLLWRNTARSEFRTGAEHGMRWLVATAMDGAMAPGILLADDELAHEPAHITIVGAKTDPAAQLLYEAARRYPSRYLRLEWLDQSEGPLPNPDVTYPDLPQAAAYACANHACSLPVTDPSAIAASAFRLENR